MAAPPRPPPGGKGGGEGSARGGREDGGRGCGGSGGRGGRKRRRQGYGEAAMGRQGRLRQGRLRRRRLRRGMLRRGRRRRGMLRRGRRRRGMLRRGRLWGGQAAAKEAAARAFDWLRSTGSIRLAPFDRLRLGEGLQGRTILADTRASRAEAEPLRPSEARRRRTTSPEPGGRIPPFDHRRILRRAVHLPEDTSHTGVTGGAGPKRWRARAPRGPIRWIGGEGEPT